MANTREDYVNQGRVAARQGNTHGEMPEYGQGNSWQAKAFAEGFNEGFVEPDFPVNLSVQADTVNGRPKISDSIEKAPVVSFHSSTTMNQATRAHINRLLSEALKGPAVRRARIVAKVAKLEAKYGARA